MKWKIKDFIDSLKVSGASMKPCVERGGYSKGELDGENSSF